MTRVKEICRILKGICQQIAEKNDIEYVTSECHFRGECEGTCPKCEAELKYLENELSKRRQLGKAVAVAGVALGIASTFSACNMLSYNTFSEYEKQLIANNALVIAGRVPSFQNPEYPGGDEARVKFLQENLVYPQEAKEQRIEGTVYIRFVVGKNGRLITVEIAKSVHPLLDKEALRVVKMMPKWEVGKKRKANVRAEYQIPITFKLKEE